MMRLVPLLAAIALSACATPLPQVLPLDGGAFAVRYDNAITQPADVDAIAQGHCAGATLTDAGARFDGFAQRTYRCPTAQGGS